MHHHGFPSIVNVWILCVLINRYLVITQGLLFLRLQADQDRYSIQYCRKIQSKSTFSQIISGTISQRYAENIEKKGNGFGYGLVGPTRVTNIVGKILHKDGSEVLIEPPEGGHNWEVRNLRSHQVIRGDWITREACRLMALLTVMEMF